MKQWFYLLVSLLLILSAPVIAEPTLHTSSFTPSHRYLLWQSSSNIGSQPLERMVHGNDRQTYTPHVDVYSPQHSNGTGVLIMAGGGYRQIGINHEALPAARWLTAHGITAAVLYYRLPSKATHTAKSAPFQDAQRAIRLLRSHATSLGIQSNHLGVMGFSAGGNLAAITATRFQHAFYPTRDHVDQQSSRPDFAALIYPVITVLPPYNHNRSSHLLGKTHASAVAYSAQLHVSSTTPPTFLAQSEDDPIASVHNSELMFEALQQHHVPSELHIFQTGKHAWGLPKQGEVAIWPELFLNWLKGDGLVSG